MSDSEHSSVTYTSVPSPVEDYSDIGSPEVDGPPSRDYVPDSEEPEQTPLSPDYVSGLEEPEQAPPSPVYLTYVPELVYPKYMPPEDDVFPAEEQPLPVAATPTADSPGYILELDPKGDLEEDDEEDPADYPADSTVVALPPVDHVPSEERLRFASPAPSQEVGESSSAGAARQDEPAVAMDDPYSLVRKELYGFVDRVDVAPGRPMSRELDYGITDTWDELVGANEEIAPTTLQGVNQRVTDLSTVVEQETTIMYGNRSRRQGVIKELLAADHKRQVQLTKALRRSKQPFILEESLVDTMADQRTMTELLRAPTEGYVEAIVVPSILAEQFELKHSLINMMISDQFFGLEKDNPHDHIRAAYRWLEKDPSHVILNWEDLVSKFINEFFPPKEQQISIIKSQTFNNDLINRFMRHKIYTKISFVHALGGNMLERRTQDVLTIIENKSKVCNSQNKSVVSQVKSSDANSNSSSEIAKLTHAVNQQTSVVTTAMIAILKQFQATPPPAFVKAIEEIYVTCGAAVNYNQGNSGYRPPGVANQIRPSGELKAITTRSGIVFDGPSVPIHPLFINLEEDKRVEETLMDQDLTEYTIKRLSSRSYLRNLETLGNFSYPRDFSELKCKALADLGASINLMPLFVSKKLGLPELISTRMTLELANRAICTPARIARDVFVPLGKFTFPSDFVIVDYESDPRVPLILGRPFLRIARALIDVHREEMILRDGDERLTLNMRHDTSSYSNQPQKESINLIDVFNDSSEDFLENLFSTNHQSGNPTFSSHLILTSPEVKYDIFDPEGGNFLINKFLDLDSTKDLHPPHHVSTISSSPNHLLEEFADELALITFPSRNDDLSFDIESDLKEIDYLIYQDPIKDIDSILKDSFDQSNLADLNDNLVDTMPEMFTDEHDVDYSSPPLYDEYDDHLFEVESNTEYVYDDPFDSKGKKIKDPKLLIDELDLPSDFLPSSEYYSFLSKDFSEVDVLPSTNNKDKVFNPCILIKVITSVAPAKNEKKPTIFHASLILEDFDHPLYELPCFKEVPRSETPLSFSFENEGKVFKPRILTSKEVHSFLIPELSHQGYKVFQIYQILKSPMKIFRFSCGEDIHILDELEGEDEVGSPPEIEGNTIEPSVDKVEVDIPKQNEKYTRRPVKYAEIYITQRPKGNQRNWNNMKSHQLGNISYLTDFKEFDGGYVAFEGGAKGGKISGKGIIRTGKLDFEDVYFVKDLMFNLFSVLQMCDKNNSVLFTNPECFVMSPDFKLADESHVLLKVLRKNNMYSVDMKNIVPKKDLTCLVVKATNDESMLWHRSLGHINFKIINKLVKENLVRGLPLKHFENDQTCVACLNGKQHKVSFKSKIQNSITQPLFMSHMDLFGPTFVSSLMHKKYSLVVTNDFSRFTWVFFLATKDETSRILKSCITKIDYLVDKKVKITRFYNGT
nr:putative ribonuclease H-like domain-containing protein [Tanacetum cinerariifolium]